MTLDEAIKSYSESVLVAINITPNPTQKGSWIVLMHDREGKSHFLVSDSKDVLSFQTVDDAVKILKEIGFRRAKLLF